MDKLKKPWKKNLYENQDYEDNYTDASFLQDLKKNYNLEKYSYFQCIMEVTVSLYFQDKDNQLLVNKIFLIFVILLLMNRKLAKKLQP